MDHGLPPELQLGHSPGTDLGEYREVIAAAQMTPEQEVLVREIFVLLRSTSLTSTTREWLPTRERKHGDLVELFSLGHFRPTWISGQAGFTVLYLSRHRDLYEYGPLRTHPEDSIAENMMKLRSVWVYDLGVAELTMCRDLLRSAQS